MTGTSPEDRLDGAGDDLLVSSFITNSSGIAKAWSPIYMAALVRVRKGVALGRATNSKFHVHRLLENQSANGLRRLSM